MKFLSTNTACAKRTAVALCTVLATMTAAVETNAQTWTGATPSAANGKTVYLYNVGAKKFLSKGGRWGTEANLNYEGVPFELSYSRSSKKFTLKSKVKGQGSSSNGYLQIMDGTTSTSTHDAGNYYVDRSTASAITPTSATTADGKTAYTLNVTTVGTSKDYYIVGNSDNAVASEETISDAAYGQWMIVTEEERREAFQAAEAANAKPVNATFLMYDFDFARNDNSISYWKTGTSASTDLSYYTSTLRLPSYAQGGTVKTYTHTYTSKHDAEYKYGSTTSSSYTSHTATFTLTTLVPGDQMPQTIIAECGGDTKNSQWSKYTHSSEEVTYSLSSTTESSSTVSAYTYYVGNGYYDGLKADATNTSEFTKNNTTYLFDAITGAQHYAEKNRQSTFGGNWTANIHGASGAVSQTLSSDNMVRKGYYRISCKAFTTATTGKVRLWAASGDNGNGSSDDQNNNDKYAYRPITAITDAPATYVAASELLQSNVTTYDASVRVYVENTTDLLKFGIYVADADASAWTCFDDFAIEYLGDPQSTLVLDEDQADGQYIKAQATNDDDELKTVKLYLHRSLNVGKWNSLVLPVDLTLGQVKSAFGDQVRISEFQGAIYESRPETIIFTAINANRDNNDETAIKAGNLYLVKPTEAMPTGLEEVDVPTTSDKISSYYSIVGVTYAKAADVASKNYNDKVEGKSAPETLGSTTNVKFVGTYIKLSDDDKIPANSYVLNGNNVGGTAGVWYYRTVKTASKGFRGWLQTIDGNASNGIKYSIDGVEETANGATTSIDNVLDENNTTISGNVYTLGGQLVKANATSLDGLAAGIYIVGGKKVVK